MIIFLTIILYITAYNQNDRQFSNIGSEKKNINKKNGDGKRSYSETTIYLKPNSLANIY